MTSGGSVSNSCGYIGYQSGGTNTVTVSDNGSTWTNSSDLYIGNNGGRGALSITSGGSVSSTYGRMGYNSSSLTGTATISVCWSAWTIKYDLYVGSSGGGTRRACEFWNLQTVCLWDNDP